MMQRGLAGFELNKNGLGLIDFDGNFLAAGQKIVLVEGVFMLDLLFVGAGHKLHAAGDLVGGRHRDPGGRYIG